MDKTKGLNPDGSFTIDDDLEETLRRYEQIAAEAAKKPVKKDADHPGSVYLGK